MVYRCLGKTGLKVSLIGLGMEHLTGKTKEQIIPVIQMKLLAISNRIWMGNAFTVIIVCHARH